MADDRESKRPRRKTWKQVGVEWIKSIAIAAAVMVPLKSSVADWYVVPTGSMEPTIIVGDRIFVNKLAYGLRIPLTNIWCARWGKPSRGEIVVCSSPESGIRLVKRVIACPGDTVELRGNILFVNGIAATYADATGEQELLRVVTSPGQHDIAIETLLGTSHDVMGTLNSQSLSTFEKTTVPEGKYFVMGDNRDQSRDSRYFGFVPVATIVGRSSTVVMSLDKTKSYAPRSDRFFKSIR